MTEIRMIQIKHGAEYPIVCNGKTHRYEGTQWTKKGLRILKPFEKCTGSHPQIGAGTMTENKQPEEQVEYV